MKKELTAKQKESAKANKVHIEAICLVAKMDTGKYHHVRTKLSDRATILQFIAKLSDSGAIELVETELDGIEF